MIWNDNEWRLENEEIKWMEYWFGFVVWKNRRLVIGKEKKCVKSSEMEGE